MERDEVFESDPSGRSPLSLDQETLLNDQFRVGRVLGIGGFGITYLAFDEVLEMVVAIKEYLPSDIAVRKTGSNTIQPLSSNGESTDFEFGLKRFLREARTLAKFEAHDNIVRVRTFFRENGTGYLVMNFYEGRTLSEYLAARNGFLPEEEALLIMEQVVDGLIAVHGENILHRDIDPSNVYLADNGTVVLLDFGAARAAIGERTQSMSVVLKRGYAPHEQYHSHGDQGAWTDVYACAATLYRILTGYKPPEAAARILDDDLAPPNELVPSLSDETNEVVQKGLSIRPDDRPQSMTAFASLLPDPPADTEPGWIGEQTTVETPTGDEGLQAELRLTTSHACRLYVDGSQAAELSPDGTYTLGVERGTHRLRAIRTDQASSGNATVTASGTTIEDPRGESRMTLNSLMWQDIVSASASEPSSVEIDFEDEDASKEPEQAVEGDSVGEMERVETGSATDSAQGTASTEGDVPVEEEETEVSPTILQVHVDRAADFFVDGEREVQLDSGEQHRLELSPGRHELRAEALDSPEEWERDVLLQGGASRTLDVSFNQYGRMIPAVFDGVPLHLAPAIFDEVPLHYVGVGVLLTALVGGWWFFGNESPKPHPDRVLTSRSEVVVDVTSNDEDPDGDQLRVVAAGPVPDSVAQVSTVDSTRLRIQLSARFAGTAQVPYEVADASGGTSRSHVTLRVPFNGRQRLITNTIEHPQVVHTDSLGGDGDLDVLIASLGNRAVSWSENTLSGAGEFRVPEAIETSVNGVVDVYTTDLNGNGRTDILSASLRDDVVSWYENQGGGSFGPPQPLSTSADGAIAVRAADFDGDGDMDVVSGALLDETISWYENLGGGEFSSGSVWAENIRGLETLHISDLDNDGVPDVLVVSYRDSTISRFEPRRNSADSLEFVKRPPIGTDLRDPIEVHTADLIGNEREEVLAGKAGAQSIVLYQNRGQATDELTFGHKRVLAAELRTIEEIDTGDVDGDGDRDIIAASFDSGKIVWFENLGDGSFGPAQPVVTGLPNVISLSVADVDRDGDLDILAASQAENSVGWYENHLIDGQK